jgi:hypothetical protein
MSISRQDVGGRARAGRADHAAAARKTHDGYGNEGDRCAHGDGRDRGRRLHCGVSNHRFCEVGMSRVISVALLVGGVMLLYFGGQSFHSINDSMSRFFTGSPATKTILLIVGGAVASFAGLIGLAMPGGKR